MAELDNGSNVSLKNRQRVAKSAQDASRTQWTSTSA